MELFSAENKQKFLALTNRLFDQDSEIQDYRAQEAQEWDFVKRFPEETDSGDIVSGTGSEPYMKHQKSCSSLGSVEIISKDEDVGIQAGDASNTSLGETGAWEEI